jgi:hypothetical protein
MYKKGFLHSRSVGWDGMKSVGGCARIEMKNV